jgi:signal transduction histidine kinase
VQEALANIFKHAQATRVDLLLERWSDRNLAIIEDNGVGFDPETAGQNSRSGLLGMRERTKMMGGELIIESIMGTGTTIYVEVPYVDSNLNR